MARKRRATPLVSAKASAKIEAVAKASFQRKKIITEIIPPDVTRAKAQSWLNLISPITEWAGLKGDALRYQRRQLRIQQEAALERLALAVRKKIANKPIKQPLPVKFLVPALEAASLEDVESPLIEWWANLLVSGATGGSVRPYLVDLMKKIGAEEASLLDSLWKALDAGWVFRSIMVEEKDNKMFANPDLVGALMGTMVWQELKGIIQRKTDLAVADWSEETDRLLGEAGRRFATDAEERGVPIRLTLPLYGGGITWQSSPILARARVSLDVARALNVVEFHDMTEVLRDKYGRYQKYEMKLLLFSDLGIEFMDACHASSLADWVGFGDVTDETRRAGEEKAR